MRTILSKNVDILDILEGIYIDYWIKRVRHKVISIWKNKVIQNNKQKETHSQENIVHQIQKNTRVNGGDALSNIGFRDFQKNVMSVIW